MSDTKLLNCSIDEIIKDIRDTRDPIRKIILKRFLDIKISRAEEGSINLIDNNILNESLSQVPLKNDKNKELDLILKKQKESLAELQKLQKKKTEDVKIIETARGKKEHVWGVNHDKRYMKYAKEDTMNNKLMERLNSEIEFRTDEEDKIRIEKPFNDNDIDTNEAFAKYD